MTVAERLLEAQREAGKDPRRMCEYLAGQVEGLRDEARKRVSHGYVYMTPQNEALVETPAAILAAWEVIDGLDAGDD